MEKKTIGTLYLKVPWGHVAAKTWGDTKSPHVLVVHGYLDNAGSFDRLIAQLPQNMYYVCIDLPGHGLSSHFQPGVTLSYYNYVLAIRYVLDELEWEKAYYMGHSLGGHLGLLFAILYPDRIQKLIVLDAVAPQPIPDNYLVQYIRKEHDLAIEAFKIVSPRQYTRDEVMFALRNLRKCCLNTEAAETLFERSVTQAGDDSYYYNRDFRLKGGLVPLANLDQILSYVSLLKVETLLILATDTLPFVAKLKPLVVDLLKNLNCVTIIEIKGNHDLHNNNPERISNHISRFLKYIPSKL